MHSQREISAPSLATDAPAANAPAPDRQPRGRALIPLHALNQAFFERIQIDAEEISGHTLNAPYAQLAPLVRALPVSNGKAAGRAPAAAKKPHNGNPRPAYTGRGFVPAIYGGASRARTGDLLAASQTLSQLSYGPWGGLSLASAGGDLD